MRGRARRVGVAVMLAAVAALASSCSSTPKTYGPCHHVVVYPPHNGGGYVAAFDWDDDPHAYGDAVPFTVCLGGLSPARTVAVEVPPGVTVDPVQQSVGSGQDGVLTFTITVAQRSSGQVRVRIKDLSEFGGPVVTPAGDGWRFTDPDQS